MYILHTYVRTYIYWEQVNNDDEHTMRMDNIRTLINFSNLIQPANTSETKVQSESSNVYKQGKDM